MKSLEEIAAVKTELEKSLLSNQEVHSVNIGIIEPSSAYPDEKYGIRVYVKSANITHADIGLNKLFKGVPVIVQYKKTELP